MECSAKFARIRINCFFSCFEWIHTSDFVLARGESSLSHPRCGTADAEIEDPLVGAQDCLLSKL